MAENKEEKVLGLYSLRTFLTLLGIWILKLIVVSLPFLKELVIPNFPMNVIQIANILFAIAIVLVIINYGMLLNKYWPIEFPKIPEAGIVFSMLIYLIVLVSIYHPLKSIFFSLLKESEAILILQIVFLVVSVVLLIRASLVVYLSMPKWLNELREGLISHSK